MKTKHKIRSKTVVIVLAVIFLLLCAALAFAGAEKEKLAVHDAAHGTAADTDPELYWDTVTAFVGKYVSE